MKIRTHRRHEAGASNLTPSSSPWRLNASDIISNRHLSNSRVPSPNNSFVFASDSHYQPQSSIVSRNSPFIGDSNIGQEQYHPLIRRKIRVPHTLEILNKYQSTPVEEAAIILNDINQRSERNAYERSKRAQSKDLYNIQSDFETQLVTVNNRLPSLSRVNQIKHSLQRRYRHRGPLKSFFHDWVEDSDGRVKPVNAVRMLERMGIQCSLDEAKELLKKPEGLDYKEFVEFIFGDKEEDKKQVVAQTSRRIHSERLNIVLSNKASSLLRNFFIKDSFAEGMLRKQSDFYDVVRRKADLPASVISDDEIGEVYRAYSIGGSDGDGKQQNCFNYRRFIEDLREFVEPTSQDINQGQNRFLSMSSVVERKRITKQQQQKEKDEDAAPFDAGSLYVSDPRNDNVSHLEWMKNRADRLSKVIRESFRSEEEFGKFLKKEQGEIGSRTIHRESLARSIQNHFNAIGVSPDQRDYQGLLQMFVYNSRGETSLEEVQRIVYHETEMEWHTRIASKPRGVIDSSEAMKEQQTERKSPQQELRGVLLKVENSFFQQGGSGQAKSLFKRFDKDLSGYVRKEEIVDQLSEKGVLRGNENKVFAQYIGGDGGGGVLDFAGFNKKIHAQMGCGYEQVSSLDFSPSTQIKIIRKRISSLKGNTENCKIEGAATTTTARAEGMIIKQQQRNDIAYNIIGAESGSALYASDVQRFSNDRVEFQRCDKQKKLAVMEQRIASVKEFNGIIEERKLQAENKERARGQARLDLLQGY